MTMSTAIQKMPTQIFARTPAEMKKANESLIGWCNLKISKMKDEHDDLAENLAIAKRSKWKISTLARHVKLALARVSYYEKMRDILKLGYMIVPNLEMAAFAIRTDSKRPRKNLCASFYRVDTIPDENAKKLPGGEGRYVSTEQQVACSQKTVTQDEDNPDKTEYSMWATGFNDVEFPIAVASPGVLKSTSDAMGQKIFDEVGIVRGSSCGDPIIIGRILDPRSTTYNPRMVTFFVAWFLPLESL